MAIFSHFPHLQKPAKYFGYPQPKYKNKKNWSKFRSLKKLNERKCLWHVYHDQFHPWNEKHSIKYMTFIASPHLLCISVINSLDFLVDSSPISCRCLVSAVYYTCWIVAQFAFEWPRHHLYPNSSHIICKWVAFGMMLYNRVMLNK